MMMTKMFLGDRIAEMSALFLLMYLPSARVAMVFQ